VLRSQDYGNKSPYPNLMNGNFLCQRHRTLKVKTLILYAAHCLSNNNVAFHELEMTCICWQVCITGLVLSAIWMR